MVDLHALFRARWFGSRGSPRLPLYAGPGVVERVQGLENDDRDVVEEVFDVHDLPGGPYQVGPFELSSLLLPHFVRNAGVRLSAPGLVVAYTGDTGPDSAVAELGRDADLFVVEASDRSQRASTPQSPEGPGDHMSGREAGQAAARAGAGRLLLTHFWRGNDRDLTRSRATDAFAGEVLLATEGLEVAL